MAAPAATIAALGAGLRRRYSDKFVSAIEWSAGPAAAQVRKIGWTGFPTWAMRVGNSPARSATFATAQSLAGNAYTNIVQPVIPTYMQDYGLATIEGRLMKAAANKEGALYDKMVAQIDGIMKGTMHSFATKIYRSGYGELSTINAATNLTTTSLQLAFPEDAVLFEIGQFVQFAASNTAAMRNAGATLQVLGIDYGAGILTMSANINTVTGVAVGDTIYSQDDRGTGASPTKICISGFEAQFNDNTALFGVTRSNDGRLRGYSFSGQGRTEEDVLIEGLAESDRFGGNVDVVYMNPTRMRNLVKLAMGRYRPTVTKGPAGIGFKGISLVTATGREVNVFADRYCPYLRIFGIESESLQLFCADKPNIPAFLDDDGNTVLRLASADGVEARVGYYAELGCNAPIHNFCATFTS